MALNFPGSPALDDVYSSPDGSSYIWNGTQWVGFSSSVILTLNTVPLRVEDDSVVAGTAITSINFGDYLDVTYASNRVTVDVNSIWNEVEGGVYRLNNVGIGTTFPRFHLEVGSVGFGGTALVVNGGIKNTGMVTFTTNADTSYAYNGYLTIGGQDINDGFILGYIKNKGNIVFGKRSGLSLDTDARRNIFIGEETGSSFSNASSSDNIYIGAYAGGSYGDGTNNIFIGNGVGYSPVAPGLTGSYNVIIGPTGSSGDVFDANLGSSQILPPILEGSYQLVVGSGNTAWIHGNESFYVGFGTHAPEEKVHIHGGLKVTGVTTASEFSVGLGYTYVSIDHSGINLNINELNESSKINLYSYFAGSDPNVISLMAPSGADTYSLTLPLNSGSLYESLTTDGNGNLTWAYPSKWYPTSSGIHTSSTVSIGTDNPIATLTVHGDTHVSGIVTASTFSGDGNHLTGIVTSIVAGNNVSISTSHGQVTVNANLAVPLYWTETATGISTINSVGIGTTNSVNTLTVAGSGTSTSQLFVSGISTFANSTEITSSGEIKIAKGDRIMFGYSGSTPNGLVIRYTDSLGSEITDVGGSSITINADSGKHVILKNDNTTFATFSDAGSNLSGITTTSVLNVGTAGTIVSTTAHGMVGIGTQSPVSKVDIRGSVNVVGVSTLTGNSTITGFVTVSNSSGAEFRVGQIQSGIGSNYGVLIQSSNGSVISNNNGSAGGYYLRTNGTNRWYVDYFGNQYGIGRFELGSTLGSPQIRLFSSGHANYSGIITASKFVGDGSQLQNILSGVGIATSGGTVGTGATIIDFRGPGISTVTVSSGIATVNIIGGSTVTGGGYWQQNATGISTTSNVGIATTNPRTPLQVENIYGVKTGFGTFTSSAGIGHTIDSFTISSTDFKTAEYTVHVGYGTHIQSQKVLVMQNGTTAYSQEYAIMYHPEVIVSIAATVTGGEMRLHLVPESGINGLTTYRFVRGTML